MDDHDENWQQRIADLYSNVAELYSHIDITVVVFDRQLDVMQSHTAAAGLPEQPVAELARRVLETGEPQRDIALDEIGRQRVHAFPLRDDASIIGVVCVIDDDGARRELFVRCAMAIFDGHRKNEELLRERERQALDDAQQANRLRDQFLAVIAHELRAPMASILLWEQVLRNPTIDSETRTQALDAIRDSAAGQAVLVADLLDVSRAINGKLHIERRVTSLLRILTMTIEDIRRRAGAKNLAVVAQLDPDLGDVLADSRRLRQIFDNVLSNAVKWTDHGRVSVVATQTAEAITVVISDTGRGIAADFLPHLFEPFRQAEGEYGDGLGLGLAIARQLVEVHDGTISAASEGIGRGATFTVILPRVAGPAHTDAPAPMSIAGARVLVVDDDALLLLALTHLLRAAGAVVTTASSAAAAYAELERGETDIVLSDIGMPAEDGYSFVQRIRATPGPMQTVPAIAVTARSPDDSRELALAAGFDRFLTKPVDLPKLIANIAELTTPA
jgi:signal transduction histidine kinase